MDDLVAFLNARLDEVEQVAIVAGRSGFPTPSYDPDWDYRDVAERLARTQAGPDTSGHVARHDPARVLREVAADRRILARYENLQNPQTLRDRTIFPALAKVVLACIRDRAAVYSHHPDYRPEWKPS